MEGGYILTKDLPAERVTSQFAGLRTIRRPVNALRGEFLVAIRGQDLVPRNTNSIPSQDVVSRKDGGKPHNYRLARDMTVTLRAEEEEVAPLDREDFLLLEAIKSAHSRFVTYISINKMVWGLSLKEGSEVFVVMNPEEPQTPQLRSRALVRWTGELGEKERGTVFGVETMDEAHRGQGSTDGMFMGKRYFTCADNCGMFVALDKLSRDREGSDLADPPPSGQQYVGQGSSHEDQQELSRPVNRSAAAILREAQRSGDQNQQPVKKEEHVTESMKQRRVAQFKIRDRVVVYTEKNAAVHGTVRWIGRYNHPKLGATFVVGIETDVLVNEDDFSDVLPEGRNIIYPAHGRGKVFMLESYVILESEAAQAAAEKKKTFQSDADATQFDAEQEETLKQVEKEIAEAAGFPKDAVKDFDQQMEKLPLERGRNKVSQTPNTAAIPCATLSSSQYDHQHSARLLGQPSPPQPHSSYLPHSQSVNPNYDGGGPVPVLEQQRGQAGEHGALDDCHRQQADGRAVHPPDHVVRQDPPGHVVRQDPPGHVVRQNPPRHVVRQDPALQEDTYNRPSSHSPARQQSPPCPSAIKRPHGHPQHLQRADQPPPQQQLQQPQPAGSAHQSRAAQAIVSAPPGHDPTPMLDICSMVQVSDPPQYGVLRWIGELPDMKGVIAGVEMEETMNGCNDGSWKGTQCFQCQPGRGYFCPLTAVHPDERFTPVGETLRGAAAVPGAASTQSLHVKIRTLELQLAEAETTKQKQLDKKEQAILELQRAAEINELHLQSQLHQKQQTVLDLQRQASETECNLRGQLDLKQQALLDLQLQASETERNLQGQMNEERQHYRSEIETVRDELARLQRQLSSREVEVWNVPRGDVKFDKEIGAGGWGSVSKGTFHGQAVAIKQLHPDIISSDNISRLRREVRLMANVRHPNILLFIAAVFDEAVDQLHPPLIVLELLDVDLRKAYKVNMVGPRNHISIFHDVACALNYLHCLREPIIHRDLSAPNVLLEAMANNRWKAKVSDFGSANLARLARTVAEGAIIYSAPESLPKEIRGPYAPDFPQTTKIDVYSYGVLLCEVMTRTLPKELGPLITELKRWPSMHTLAITCTSYNPDDRPTVASILTELHKLGQ